MLAHAGLASRRAAERLIADGRVRVNGSVVRELGTRVDPAHDKIELDGREIPRPRTLHTYLVLNKPRDVVTSASDPQGRRTVLDLVRKIGLRVYPVGRLDYHSEGLLLLTDDGALTRDLLDPKRHVPKTYLLKVRGVPGPRALARLEQGIVLDGRRTRPASARIVRSGRNAWIEITVTEGRRRQLRRMLEVVGHPVQRLRRTAFAGLKLGGIRPGEFRQLTTRELERLRRAASRRN